MTDDDDELLAGLSDVIRWIRAKDPLATNFIYVQRAAVALTPTAPDVERVADLFWAKVKRGAADDCWPWTGSRSSRGYGSFNMQGKTIKAHRLAYTLTQGKIPDGLLICHRCDNPPCCNPAHLFAGTSQDNVADCVAKGRHIRPERDESKVNYTKGERSNFSKLTESAVRDIRVRRAAGERVMDLAGEYGVDRTLIWQIVNRKAWSHVE